jgi:proteasome lid subunit RPN8/RPN11
LTSVSLAPGVAAAIHAAARAAAPRECCGLLEGERRGGDWRVTALYPARNLAAQVDAFDIDPAGHFAAVRAARARGLAIIGCYHSHPGGRPVPSARDLAGAGQDDFLWLIAADGGLGAFVYSAGGFRGLPTGADWVTSSE